jgi:hypothetical protein
MDSETPQKRVWKHSYIKSRDKYQIGIQEPDVRSNFSNWREFDNIVKALEGEAASGNIHGTVVDMFTDKLAYEAALCQGNSSTSTLFDLVLHCRKLEMDQGAHFRVACCSGECKKAKGINGVSQCHLKEGITAGMGVLGVIPLNKTCFEQEPKLKDRLKNWAGDGAEFLEPRAWFRKRT